MKGRPQKGEVADYYFTYIDKVGDGDIVSTLEAQLQRGLALFAGISEQASRHRYAPDKWSIRQVLNHINDAERVFAFRALWFARGLPEALPSFDQDITSAAAHADECAWRDHVDEFRVIRLASIALLRNLPDDAWLKRGIASGNAVSVRGLAYIIAGHAEHHLGVLNERYLQ